LTAIAALHEALPGMTFRDLDEAVGRLAAAVDADIKRQVAAYDLPTNTRVAYDRFIDSAAPKPAGFRSAIDPQVPSIRAQLMTQPPANARVDLQWDLLVTTGRDRHATFLVIDGRSSESYEFAASDLVPELSEDARSRVSAIIDSSLREGFRSLRQEADANLRKQGFES
jgi:hypothetical protein